MARGRRSPIVRCGIQRGPRPSGFAVLIRARRGFELVAGLQQPRDGLLAPGAEHDRAHPLQGGGHQGYEELFGQVHHGFFHA